MNNYIGIVLLLALAGCGDSSQQNSQVEDSTAVTTPLSAAKISFEEPSVEAIYSSYIDLKNALVNEKYDEAQKVSSVLSTRLNAYKGCENTALIADKITAAKDIKDQRKEFTSLSADVIAMFKHANLKEGTIFVQHCPMANNGDGGDWLSSNKEIRNPYYGDEMMECGAVIEEIK